MCTFQNPDQAKISIRLLGPCSAGGSRWSARGEDRAACVVRNLDVT